MTQRGHAARTDPFRTALSFFTDPALQKRTLAYAIVDGIRYAGCAGIIIRSLMQRPWSQRGTWEHLKNNWDSLRSRSGMFQGIPGVVQSLQYLLRRSNRGTTSTRFSARHRVAGRRATLRGRSRQSSAAPQPKSAQADDSCGISFGERSLT